MYNHYMYPDELWHHGVMGMRWGVRRYQNYDGTRIGTGGKPVIDASKQAGETFKNSVAGGQGGKAEGNARLAASAKSRPSAKDIAKKAVTPSVKQGKGREDISPAEDITKKVKRVAESGERISEFGEKHDKKTQQKNEDAYQKQMNKAKKMSDKELRDSINRIKMEREYSSLTTKETESGWTKAKEIFSVGKEVIEITGAIVGIIASIMAIKKGLSMKQSDISEEEMELKRLLALDGMPDDVIAHAVDLDEGYIMQAYDISEKEVEDYLAHHGVLGMKWGVRRYQNYDGTLKAAGRKHLGVGSGSGGGGGGSKKASKPFRDTVVGGQGGNAKGNARLAAKPIGFGSGKKSPSDSMRRDIESINFSSKVRKARDQQHREMGLPDDATTVSTGKNYDRVLDKMSKESQPWDDKFGSRLEKFSNDIDNYNLRVLRGEQDKKEYNRLKTEEAEIMSSYKKHTEELLTKYNDEFNAATLKDLGYDEEHVSAGVEYCRRNKKKLYEVYTIF